jgi:hypothetical protein
MDVHDMKPERVIWFISFYIDLFALSIMVRQLRLVSESFSKRLPFEGRFVHLRERSKLSKLTLPQKRRVAVFLSAVSFFVAALGIVSFVHFI